MRKLLLTIFICTVTASSCFAANFFVRPNGGTYGAENGSDWDNAYNGFSDISWASVSCGDTIWVAGGTYTQQMAPIKNCTAGNELSIRRARTDASACTSATGWSSGFDSTIEHATGPTTAINFTGTSNYVTVSGRTTAAGGTQGWHIYLSGATGLLYAVNFSNTSNTTNIVLEYLDIEGPNQNWTDDARGIDCTPTSGSGNYHTYAHNKIHGWGTAIYAVYCSNGTYEYNELYNLIGNALEHGNTFYIHSAHNGIVRFNNMHDNIGEGVALSDLNTGTGANGWQIYGNVMHDVSKAISVQDAVANNTLIYNNTFVNNTHNCLRCDLCGTGSESRNNLQYNNTVSTVACGTSSNNITAGADPFTNLAGDDYTLSAATANGYTLNHPYDEDVVGNTRGADGNWDSGAYEYTDSDSTPPTVVTASINGATATIGFSEVAVTTNYSDADFNLDCTLAGNNISLSTPVGSGSSRTFTAAVSVAYGDVCNLDYVGALGHITDVATNNLATFNNQAVTNDAPLSPLRYLGVTFSGASRQ